MSTKRFPDFIVLGAQKAGTTWLGARLNEQPGVFLPNPFEVNYFSHARNYKKGPDWYAAKFENAPADSIVGEKTPGYFWTVRPPAWGPNDIPERMHDLVPDARLIVVLRDPVKRAISALNHYVRSRAFSPFVNPDKVLTEALEPAREKFGLIGHGLYLRNLKRYLTLYPRERICVLFFEDDIVASPDATLDRVMRFLGREKKQPIKEPLRPENRRMNSRVGLIANYFAPRLGPVVSAVDRLMPAGSEIVPSDECRARLYDYFAPHNEALFEFLGRKTDAWTSRGHIAS